MRHASLLLLLGVFLPLPVALAGCGSDSDDDHSHEEEAEGTPTQSTCPSGSTLTYDTFGKAFMQKYCTRCHSSTVTGAARQGAPDDHNFDTLAGVVSMAAHIDGKAAAGPAATNTSMPPSGDVPTTEERKQLGEWLACEVAKK